MTVTCRVVFYNFFSINEVLHLLSLHANPVSLLDAAIPSFHQQQIKIHNMKVKLYQ